MGWWAPTPVSGASPPPATCPPSCPSPAVTSAASSPASSPAPSRGASPLVTPRSEPSPRSSTGERRAVALGGSVHQWLERIKQGYGRFNVAFEALGVEDTADISNVDHAIFAQIETLLREACDAKSMHIKNIRLALQDAGCILSGPAVAAASAPAPSSVPVKRTAVGLPPSPQQQQQHMRRRAQSPSISPACSSSVAAAASPLRRTGRKPSPTLPSPAGAPSSVPPLPPPFFLPAAVEALAGASMITEATQVWAATAHAPSAEAPKPPRPLLRQSDSGLARAEQWEEVVSAMTAQAQAAGGLWPRLAYGVETEAELQKFFSRRQVGTAGGKTLHIASAVKVVNNAALTAFASAHAGFHMNPLKAHKAGGDTLLFHGCPQESATNIQADGAPDPRKSEQFCKNSANGKFMFVCRFNMKHAQHAGPETRHRNTIFDEFCVYDERHVVVLWMVKLR